MQRGILHEHGQNPPAPIATVVGCRQQGRAMDRSPRNHQREGDEVEQHCAEDLVDVDW